MTNSKNDPPFDGAPILTGDTPQSALAKYWWWICCLMVTLVAVFFRFWDLTLKPLHHDEGVNGYFLLNLFRDGAYKYDPSNYHGPTLYYIALFFTKVFGLETYSIRASVGVFGVLLVLMAFSLRKYIGPVGSIVAALLIGLSPGMVFISRYFIHEIFFVFCSFGIVLGVLFFIEGRKAGPVAIAAMTLLLLICLIGPLLNAAGIIAGDNQFLSWGLRVGIFLIESVLVFFIMRMLAAWNDGRPIYLLLASASAALFFATKETAFITIGTCLIACVCVFVWRKLYAGVIGGIGENTLEPNDVTWGRFWQKYRESNPGWLTFGIVFTFIVVAGVFFTSFFTYPAGILKAFEAYAFWTKTGTGDHTQNGFLAYVKWGAKIEGPILLLAGIGALIALLKGKHRFAIFTAFWAFGLFAAYTIIPYKTPWLALSYILPMCLIGGYGINELLCARDILQKLFGTALILASVIITGYQSYDLSFVHYDDDSMPYVYAHTRRGFLDLMAKIEHYGEKSGKGEEATIEIVSPDYWPMPWYTRNFPHANYHGKIVDATTSEMILAKKGEQDADIARNYAAHYREAGTYPLRPGVDLILLVRRDLADKDTTEIYPELDETPVVDITPEPTPPPKKDSPVR